MPNFPLAPPQASTYAQEYDPLFYTMVFLAVFFTGLVFSLVVFFAIRYRRGTRYSRANAPDHNVLVEIIWSVIPLVLALGVFFWAVRPFAKLYGPPPADALEVFVVGKQWMWHFQHPNGVRENNELHVPVGKPVKLTMISQDVIHSIFVPAFRIKRDVLPGRYTSVTFTPTKAGKYYLFCTEYCGTQHSEMGGFVYVMEPRDFQAWLASGGTRTVHQVANMEQAGSDLVDKFACMSCHGYAPARAPSLVGLFGAKRELEGGKTVVADEAYLRESIVAPDAKVTKGYQAIMPSFKGQISEQQVLEMIAFIKSLEQPAETPGSEGAGTAAGTNQGAAAEPSGSVGR